jgi:DNA-binding PadR family transcriptional regulator
MKFPTYLKAIAELEKLGYIVPVEVPGQRHKKKKGWALTQKGRDVEKDYEKFYDEKMADLKNQTAGDKPNSRVRFEDGQYFRRVRKRKGERRAAQGGGMLPRTTPLAERYKDAYPDAKPNDEQA